MEKARKPRGKIAAKLIVSAMMVAGGVWCFWHRKDLDAWVLKSMNRLLDDLCKVDLACGDEIEACAADDDSDDFED